MLKFILSLAMFAALTFGQFQVDESYLARFYAAAQEQADVINQYEADVHVQACKNAAQNATQTGKEPIAISAKLKIRPRAGSFPSLEWEKLSEPVSKAKPQDYMAAKPSEDGVVGEGVGGRIPGTANFYYDRTNQMHDDGELKSVGARRFVYRRYSLTGFWRETF